MFLLLLLLIVVILLLLLEVSVELLLRHFRSDGRRRQDEWQRPVVASVLFRFAFAAAARSFPVRFIDPNC